MVRRLALLFILAALAAEAIGQKATITAAEAKEHVGESATVCGVVASAKFAENTRRQPTFLNLDRPYPDHVFTVVIWGEDRARFGAPEKEYAGKRLCVTGLVKLYKDRPEIIATNPKQLTIGGESK